MTLLRFRKYNVKHNLFFLVLACVFISSVSYSQCTIRGKVTDDVGDPAIGATIVLKSKPGVGAATDLDGNYILKISDSIPQVLVVSYISYQTIEETIKPIKNQVIIKNFSLKSVATQMIEVEVVAKANHGGDNFVEKMKLNSATTLDVIGAGTIKKTGDPNVAAAVARVPGVSTSSTGFITVRGIGDRYVKTTLNGLRIPTLDPYTNNIRLDMFPSSLVDNIVLTKTASPDLPGDWAGAYLSVQTKDYPDKLSVNVESSFGYNNQSTFKEIVSSRRSSTDWLGYDKDLRVHDHSEFKLYSPSVTRYNELVALGLGDYYKSMGLGYDWSNDINANTYYKMGLVELGLLGKAAFDDPAAYAAADAQYKNNYQLNAYNMAFTAKNEGAAKSGQSFANNWSTVKWRAPVNFTQSFSVGNQIDVFKRPLGFLIGFRYGNLVQYDPNSTSNRPTANYSVDGTLDSKMRQRISQETNGWSALLNLAYKVSPNHSFSLLFMPNFTGVNNVRDAVDSSDFLNTQITRAQFYEQRRQIVYQYKSEHYIPGPKIKIDANASYTKGRSSAPDFKLLTYLYDPVSKQYQIGPTAGSGIHRFYRYLSDNLFDSNASAEMPIDNKPGLTRKIKIGGAYQFNNKKNDLYDYAINTDGGVLLKLDNDNVDEIFGLDQFAIQQDTNGKNLINLIYTTNQNLPTDHFLGSSTTSAAFAMLDYAFIPSLRFTGGLRFEHAIIFTDSYLFDSLGYKAGDERRNFDAVNFNQKSLLPSANFIYKLKQSENAPVNLRFNYSQTVARPSIRELSNFWVIDYELRQLVTGNPGLKMVNISNYDAKYEHYFNSGENFSVSLFYKDFINHIELVFDDVKGYTWQNAGKSNVKGIEIEGRKSIIKNVEFRANLSLIKSISQLPSATYAGQTINTSHPMFGQAPYVVNTILAYNNDSIGFTAALSYNIQGPRLAIVTSQALADKIPNVYDLPRHLIDFKISKSIGKHFSTSFTARNILNAPIRRSYKYADGWLVDYDKIRYGANYLLSFSYKL